MRIREGHRPVSHTQLGIQLQADAAVSTMSTSSDTSVTMICLDIDEELLSKNAIMSAAISSGRRNRAALEELAKW